jgi:hypothetical protein
MSYPRRTESSATLLRKPTHSPTAIQLHHFTIKCTPLPKFSLKFLDYFFTLLQPYKRINYMTRQDGEHIYSGNSSNVPSEYTNQACLEGKQKYKKKKLQTAMLFVTITYKVHVRRATTTMPVDQALKLVVTICDWNLLKWLLTNARCKNLLLSQLPKVHQNWGACQMVHRQQQLTVHQPHQQCT